MVTIVLEGLCDMLLLFLHVWEICADPFGTVEQSPGYCAVATLIHYYPRDISIYPIAGNVCGECNFAVYCFDRNSQTLHLLKFLAHICINDCGQ